jgi:hypothetical protein
MAHGQAQNLHRLTDRPTKYRRDVADWIIEAVTDGGSIKRVCAAEGVRIGTLYEWAAALDCLRLRARLGSAHGKTDHLS